MTRYVRTCEGCGGSDIHITAWVHANKPGIINDDPPTEQNWCVTCQREVECFFEEVADLDPQEWIDNGYRCAEPACVPREGCDACAYYVCPSCLEVRVWYDGGAPDPRCNACWETDPEEHVTFAVPRADLYDLHEALERHEEFLRERAAQTQAAAYCARESMIASGVLSVFPEHLAGLYALARQRAEVWIRFSRLSQQIMGARAPKGMS